jgi:hypothetical protein
VLFRRYRSHGHHDELSRRQSAVARLRADILICRRQGDRSKPDTVGVLGPSGPGEYSFSLPMPLRCISPVRHGCYRASPMGWGAARTLPPFWSFDQSSAPVGFVVQNRAI